MMAHQWGKILNLSIPERTRTKKPPSDTLKSSAENLSQICPAMMFAQSRQQNAVFLPLFSANGSSHRVMLVCVMILAVLSNSLCHAAIFSMAELADDQQMPQKFAAHPRMLVGWEEFLKQQHLNPGYQEFIVLDKVPAKAGAKVPAKRGDEKRRDFEHGWEQCEFSPISCMLRRRR